MVPCLRNATLSCFKSCEGLEAHSVLGINLNVEPLKITEFTPPHLIEAKKTKKREKKV